MTASNEGPQQGAMYDLGGATAVYWPDIHPCHESEAHPPWLVLYPEGDTERVAELSQGRLVGYLPGFGPSDIGDLDDFTAALTAADVVWSRDLGDAPSEPDYIQALARAVWGLWVQPRLAAVQASYWEVKETLESLKAERGADL